MFPYVPGTVLSFEVHRDSVNGVRFDAAYDDDDAAYDDDDADDEDDDDFY